jgi:hypothetical protein
VPPDDSIERLEARLRRRRRWLIVLRREVLRGPRDGAIGWLLVAWGLAVLARLTLAQTAQGSWLVPSLLLVCGAIGLLVWGGRLFWLMSALGLAIPLFFLRDWLTQTVIMLAIALVGLATSREPEGGRNDTPAGRGHLVCAAAGWLTVVTYLLAAFHKLNRDFFDPGVSCANDTIAQLDGFFPSVDLSVLDPLAPWLPHIAVGFELAVALALAFRPRLGFVLGLLFHIPLTLVLAPAFVFVMLVGYAGRLTEADRQALSRSARRRWRGLAAGGAGLVALMWWAGGGPPEAVLAAKQLLLVYLLVWATLTLLAEGWGGAWSGRARLRRRQRVALAGLLLAFLANGLTPYLGTQFQHTGAMLSNLRIDPGCWNHLLMPERLRRADNYLRVDEASLGGDQEGRTAAGGRFPETERLLRERLWSVTQLRQMRRNWCDERTRPIALRGSYRGRPFVIDDLCDSQQPLPDAMGVWGGPALFPDYLRFQKNLSRRCPQACIH